MAAPPPHLALGHVQRHTAVAASVLVRRSLEQPVVHPGARHQHCRLLARAGVVEGIGAAEVVHEHENGGFARLVAHEDGLSRFQVFERLDQALLQLLL